MSERLAEVDKLQASNRARELADQSVKDCFPPRLRESMAAQLHWAREFRRQFDAYTKPDPYDATAHAAAYPGY